MKSLQKLCEGLLHWADTEPGRAEYGIWFFVLTSSYLIWALVVKPVAIDFNIYQFAGYAYREGISPYDMSPAAYALASRYDLLPFTANYLYPPFFAQVMSVLVLLPYPALRAFFTIASTIAFLSGIWAINAGSFRGIPRYLLMATALFFPVLNCIAAGQINLLMLGSLAGMAYLVRGNSLSRSWKKELLAGGLLGLTFVFKPVLWPLGVWTLLRRRYGVFVGCLLVATVLVAASILTGGITPWLDYASVLRSFTSPDRYVENQSLVGVVARLAGVDPATLIQFVSPLALLGLWFASFRHLPADLESASLAAVAVLISPVAWYYYGVLLIPAFWLLAGRYRLSDRRFMLSLIVAYALIQVHQLTWYRFPESNIITDLDFFGTSLLVVLIFIRAYGLSRAQVAPKDTSIGSWQIAS